MKTDVVLQKWNDAFINKAGPVSVDSQEVKLVLSRVKALELALADALRPSYGKRVAARNW